MHRGSRSFTAGRRAKRRVVRFDGPYAGHGRGVQKAKVFRANIIYAQ